MVSMAPDVKRSSQKVKNVVLGLLALWSIISLVVIVVWATSPDLKGSAECRKELQLVKENLEGARVVCNNNKVELEEQLEARRQQQEQQEVQMSLLLQHLSATNASLEECRQDQVSICSSLIGPASMALACQAVAVMLGGSSCSANYCQSSLEACPRPCLCGPYASLLHFHLPSDASLDACIKIHFHFLKSTTESVHQPPCPVPSPAPSHAPPPAMPSPAH